MHTIRPRRNPRHEFILYFIKIIGGAGDDVIVDAPVGRSVHGDDILEGGTGNDTLEGGEDDDVYLFNAGDGQDTIFDNGPLFGVNGGPNADAVRFGQAGNDTLDGGAGHDVYLFGLGDGADIVDDRNTIPGGFQRDGFDTIRFNDTITPGAITLARSGTDPAAAAEDRRHDAGAHHGGADGGRPRHRGGPGGARVLVIRNTVTEAVATFQAVRQAGAEALLLTASDKRRIAHDSHSVHHVRLEPVARRLRVQAPFANDKRPMIRGGRDRPVVKRRGHPARPFWSLPELFPDPKPSKRSRPDLSIRVDARSQGA